jgi:flagellar hook-associated protein 3 FlgL
LELTDLLDEFTADLDRVTVAQAKLGANMNTVSNASDRLDSAYKAYKELMTGNENIDIAAGATELTSANYTYEAALAVGAKAISKSLIDYIA